MLIRFFLCVSLLTAAANAAEIVLPSAAFTSQGNYVANEIKWDNLGVFHGIQGTIQAKFTAPEQGSYHAAILLATETPRPFKFTLTRKDGKLGGEVNPEPTGGFFAKHLKWKALLYSIALQKGEEGTITLSFNQYMPHFKGIVLYTGNKTPNDITVFDKAEQTLREQKRAEQQAASRTVQTKLAKMMPDVKELLFIRRATFQSTHYYTDFIDGSKVFGCELSVLNLADGTVRSIAPALRDGIIGRCNLSFDGKKAIFDYKAKIGEGFRIWEVNLDGTGLKQLTFPPADEDARIAKYRLDPKQQSRAAFYHHHTDDMHPAYLPDGGFVFASTRCEHGILCDGPDILSASVLYRAVPNPEPDDKNKDEFILEKLSDNALSESCPSVMEDGRILYTRWEYVDNGSVTNKGLWAVNPDGTGSQEVYGSNIAYPSVFNTARQIPGKAEEFVCIGAPHMPLGVGTVLFVNSASNRRTVNGVRYITPEIDQQFQSFWTSPIDGKAFTRLYEPEEVGNSAIQTHKNRDGGGKTSTGPLYMDPFPLDEHHFIVSHNPKTQWNDVNGWALYLIDDEGGRYPLYEPEKLSAWCPIPVRAVETPPMRQGLRLPVLEEQNLAQLVVVDVYTGMDNVERGKVKYLRVNEHVPRPWSARRYWKGDEFDQQHSVITMNTHLGLKVQHGIVKVEDDGSANFYVPADKNIFLQALDENYREIQRERTFVNYRPGEVRSCIGCHEQASDTRPQNSSARPKALKRAPQMPGPQPGELSGSRPLSYIDDVQPVWNKHCVQCHNAYKKEGGIDLSSGLTPLFNRSYESLMNWDAMPVIRENHPKAGNNHYMPPYTLGSYSSKLVKLLDAGHYDVKLLPEEMVKVTTWTDSNGQYYGSYFGRKNLQYKAHPNFRPVPKFADIESAVPPIADGP